jgi:YaiO family outer membrane protein
MPRAPVSFSLVVSLLALGTGQLLHAVLCEAQTRDSVHSSPGRAPFHLEVGGFLQSLDRGYGTWRGGDARLQWSSPRITPFVFASTQTRDAGATPGSQQNFGGGSYLTLTSWLYTVVSVSAAPDRGIVLYPKLRTDASLVGVLPGIQGLRLSAGLTDIKYSAGAGGRIVSVGPFVYVGRGIYNAVARFNHDRASGANSRSVLVSGQYGTQGNYWVGGSLGGGNEAYQVLGATPFDARFDSRELSAFVQRWIARRQGFSLRYDFENKLRTYHRNGATLTYFVDF